MFCRRCGAELPAGAAACPRCQEPVVPPGMPAGLTPVQPSSPSAPYPPFTTGQWSAPTQAGPPIPPTGEQFSPPPSWAPSVPPSAWLTNAGATGSVPPPPPPPPARPLLEPLFGPTPRPGVVLAHINGVQRRFFSRLQPTTAGSAWFGALAGALVAFLVSLCLATICSLLLGGILDQAFASTAAALNLLSGSTSATGTGSQGISFYSNPLILFDYAHRSAFILKVGVSLSGTAGNASLSITPPITLLLLLPAIGLTFGGYVAASTDYTGRRLFSIARGASICLVYALLALLLSLVTSVNLFSATTASSSTSITLAPDSLTVFLSALFWGLIFGALGGALRARAFPAIATDPPNRRNLRLLAAWQGARHSLTIFFAICLALLLALYLLAQLGGPTLQTEGSPVRLGSTSSTPCHVFLQTPTTAPSPLPSSGTSSGAAGPVWFLVDSPPLAVWVMSLSLGAPLQISGNGLAASLNASIGLVNADCGPGSQGALLYLLLVIPAVAIFLGARRAARSAQDSTVEAAAGTGLLFAGMLALGLVVLGFLASITLSLLGTDINIGPSLLGTLIAALLYGAVIGLPTTIMARTGSQPQLTPFAYASWPMGPGAAASAGQPPQPPAVSMAVTSVHTSGPGMPPSPFPASGAGSGSAPLQGPPAQLSGPPDLHHVPTLISGGMVPSQMPPAIPGGADIWHAPTQAPGSGSILDAPTQASNPNERSGPLPPNPHNPAGQP